MPSMVAVSWPCESRGYPATRERVPITSACMCPRRALMLFRRSSFSSLDRPLMQPVIAQRQREGHGARAHVDAVAGVGGRPVGVPAPPCSLRDAVLRRNTSSPLTRQKQIRHSTRASLPRRRASCRRRRSRCPASAAAPPSCACRPRRAAWRRPAGADFAMRARVAASGRPRGCGLAFTRLASASRSGARNGLASAPTLKRRGRLACVPFTLTVQL